MFQIIRESKYEHIEKFVLYGERHCGTKFLQESLECYNVSHTGYFGGKHWMGFANPEKIQFTTHTMFICIIRDPYQWLAAFMNNAHHVPKHNRKWTTFLTNEWYSINHNQTEIFHDRNFATNHRYKNIFEMRNTKNIYMFYDLPKLCKNYVFLTYENLLTNHIHIMNIIQNKFNLVQTKELPKPREPIIRSLPSQHMQYINSQLDWHIENCLGYTKL